MPKATPIDPTTKLRREEVLARIVTKMIDLDQTFMIDGTPMLTVQMKDETYRKKPALGGLEFFFRSAKLGKSGQPLFVFEPEDAQEWMFAELSMDDLDKYLPLFGPRVAAAFAIEDLEAMPLVFHEIELEYLREEDARKKEQEAACTNHPLYGRF